MGPQPGWPKRTRRQVPRRGRKRRCLLKGCGQWFLPSHPRSRYCGRRCGRAARAWREWKAQQRYRASKKGKKHRRGQSRRRRKRLREDRAQGKPTVERIEPAVGHRKHPTRTEKSCDRPGCYDLFRVATRSPMQRFCSSSCRKALRCVRLREASRKRRRYVLARRASPSRLRA